MSNGTGPGMIVMHSPGGQKIKVVLDKANIKVEGNGIKTYTADIAMDYETYRLVDEMELFNLEKDVRGQGSEDAFRPEATVEMEILLRKDIAEFIMITADTEELFFKHLSSRSEKVPGDSVLDTENWYALNVKQDVELPPALKALGTAKSGYRTEWAKMKEQL